LAEFMFDLYLHVHLIQSTFLTNCASLLAAGLLH
jgi:hypothetical protein